MRIRDSGMPDEEIWRGFFDVEAALSKLELTPDSGDVVEFGCGYGTFTLPAARVTQGTVHTFDVDPAMVRLTRDRARAEGLDNVRVVERDFKSEGTGLPDGSCGYAMVFNILHPTEPAVLLGETHRVLHPGGTLALMHWNHDPATPRGPDMAFRPRPEACLAQAAEAGFIAGSGLIDLPPYHWGAVMRRASSPSR